MRKALMIGAAVALFMGVSAATMAQPRPCAYPNCPAVTGEFDGYYGPGPGYGQGYGPGYGGRGWGHHGWKRGGGYGGGPGMMAGGYVWYGLNLTDAQIAEIEKIRQQQRLETHEKIRNVLTPEQRAIFDQRFQAMQLPAQPTQPVE